MIAALRPRYAFPEIRCAYCRAFPCECAPLARCVCACGATLEAKDDLESKRSAAEMHARTSVHLNWRAGR